MNNDKDWAQRYIDLRRRTLLKEGSHNRLGVDDLTHYLKSGEMYNTTPLPMDMVPSDFYSTAIYDKSHGYGTLVLTRGVNRIVYYMYRNPGPIWNSSAAAEGEGEAFLRAAWTAPGKKINVKAGERAVMAYRKRNARHLVSMKESFDESLDEEKMGPAFKKEFHRVLQGIKDKKHTVLSSLKPITINPAIVNMFVSIMKKQQNYVPKRKLIEDEIVRKFKGGDYSEPLLRRMVGRLIVEYNLNTSGMKVDESLDESTEGLDVELCERLQSRQEKNKVRNMYQERSIHFINRNRKFLQWMQKKKSYKVEINRRWMDIPEAIRYNVFRSLDDDHFIDTNFIKNNTEYDGNVDVAGIVKHILDGSRGDHVKIVYNPKFVKLCVERLVYDYKRWFVRDYNEKNDLRDYYY